MDYEGFLELAEVHLSEKIAQKEGIEELQPEVYVTAVTTIESSAVRQSDDNEIQLVIIITKEV